MTLRAFAKVDVTLEVETNLVSESSETRTAKDYYRDHRDRVMVICGKEGQAVEERDFFVVESVGTISGGLLITGIFDQNRRERMRSDKVRLATEQEIALRPS